MTRSSGKTILHDLSPAIGRDSEVWPGDSPFEQSWTSSMERGDGANVARITLSPHTGSHVDAPLHLGFGDRDAATAREREAELGISQCFAVHRGDSLRAAIVFEACAVAVLVETEGSPPRRGLHFGTCTPTRRGCRHADTQLPAPRDADGLCAG